MSTPLTEAAAAVVWHDLECGGYADDLWLWEELAEAADGPVLEIGCGAGRVALHLARRGHEVLGLDTQAELIEALNDRALEAGVAARGELADATSFERDRRFSLVTAPMQVVQILGGPAARKAMLACVAAQLEPGGRFAAAMVSDGHLEPGNAADDGAPLPDVLDQDVWVYSSLPLSVASGPDGRIMIERLRQVVAPDGALTEEVDITILDSLSPEILAAEAEPAGLRLVEAREIPATERYIGSVIAILEAP